MSAVTKGESRFVLTNKILICHGYNNQKVQAFENCVDHSVPSKGQVCYLHINE